MSGGRCGAGPSDTECGVFGVRGVGDPRLLPRETGRPRPSREDDEEELGRAGPSSSSSGGGGRARAARDGTGGFRGMCSDDGEPPNSADGDDGNGIGDGAVRGRSSAGEAVASIALAEERALARDGDGVDRRKN
mmetsp:Transcript_3416/g.12275  ORF Transcript_3416/g.12275 Transcript_3416/m.12275 type:complete len:134 (+) Transcript_3416:2355-2756(+)